MRVQATEDVYQAESPDEEALVMGAKHVGLAPSLGSHRHAEITFLPIPPVFGVWRLFFCVRCLARLRGLGALHKPRANVPLACP